MYVYEYQKRGAIHFHILFNRKIHKSVLPQWWPFGFNDVRVVQKGTNENIVKYLSKYVVKGWLALITGPLSYFFSKF
nr:helitron helicase-like domain-containing protein [Spiroplasma endosymbiont of Lariophagus distinguendus]